MPNPKLGTYPLTVQQEKVVRLKANGYTNPEIIKEVWGYEPGDKGFHAKEMQIWRWMKHPDVTDVWKDEIKRQALPMMSEALRTLRGQIKEKDQPWLQNKAANDVLAFSGKQAFGDDARNITVSIEGMPNLGKPETEDDDE